MPIYCIKSHSVKNVKKLRQEHPSSDKIMHTLFLLEDELGFFIDREDGRYCLCLKCQHPRYDDMHELLAEWYEFYMKYQKSRFDPAEYDNWRYRYPLYNPEFKDEDSHCF